MGRSPGGEPDNKRSGFSLAMVRSMLPSLRPSERRVAEYVLADPEEVIHLSIGELARRCGSSDAAIVRFSRAVGCPGYWGLKIAVAREMASTAGAGLSAASVARAAGGEASGPGCAPASVSVPDTARIVAAVVQESLEALVDTQRLLDVASLDRATDALAGCSRVLFAGIGASGLVAQDACYKFSRIGIVSVAFTDTHMQAAIASLLGPADCCVAMSHSGSTSAVVTMARTARECGATTIAITGYAGSALAQACEVVLLTGSRESIFRTGAGSSRIAQLAVVDALLALVVARRKGPSLDSLDRVRRAIAALEL